MLGTVKDPIVLGELVDESIVYPNPFDHNLNLTLDAKVDQEVTIQLFSITGQLVFVQKMKVVAGANNLIIAPEVTTGTYLLQIEINGKTLIDKVIKN